MRLLGGWQLVVGGVDVQLSHREQRLTALLGLTGRSSRAHVSGMLWPESTDARALASLRRAVLQTQERSPGLLRADRTDLGLDPGVEVDVVEVRRAAGLTELPMPGRDAEALLAALVGEPLLPAWYDDWVLAERERIEQMRVRALERIARHAFEMGDLVQAIDAARAAVDIDPLLDSARELAIRAHLGQGDRGSALREFHRYRDAMSHELGVAPSSSILALVEPVIAADGAEEAPRRIEPAAGRAVPVVVPRPRTEQGPIPPDPAPRVPPPHAPAPTGVRGAVARLLAVAALVLAASLALAGGGPDAGDGGSDGQGAASLQTGNVPAPGLPGAAAGSRPAEDSSQARQVVVRRVDAAYGSAAFVVRATLRPALVRVLMRGPSGRTVARGVVVRSQGGRRLVLDGLDPGTYRWLVTSPTASPVSGRVTVADQPEAVASTPTPGPSTTSIASPQPTPAAQPTPSPQPTPTPQPTVHPTPSPQPSPHRTPQPSPTATPTDPGTVAPTPVG